MKGKVLGPVPSTGQALGESVLSLLPVRWRLMVNLQRKGEWRRQPPGAPEEVSVPEMKKDDLWLFWGGGEGLCPQQKQVLSQAQDIFLCQPEGVFTHP